jgi:hypothetical protein
MQMGPLFDIKLGYPHMQAGNQMGRGGAAGDHLQIGAGLCNHHIVNVLREAFLGDVQAGLHRMLNVHPFLGTDKITFMGCRLGLGSEGVLFRLDVAPTNSPKARDGFSMPG